MHSDVFTQLSLVIVVATVISLIMRLLRQPLIMGYILTGIVVGPMLLDLIQDKSTFTTFSEIGITLLLFIIGLELSVAVVKRLGKPVFLTATAILMTVGTAGYLLGSTFHFTTTESVILGLALFFSSTIIIAKVLSDKKELTRTNGQIAIGVILFDDIVATFALLFVAASSGGSLGANDIGLLVLKGVGAVALLALVSVTVLPKVTKYIAKSQELLFLFALAWGFGIASLVNYIGFSVEVGALFAGVSLAHLPYTHQIGARLTPLRDFFIILFFISLGESLQVDSVTSALVPAIILSAIVIIAKPIVVMATLGVMGYTKRTSFKTGINLSQISEFSIILVVLSHSAGLVGDRLATVITLIAIITIAISTYLMSFDNWLYAKFEKKLSLFERKTTSEAKYVSKAYPLVLFGYRNGGHQLLKAFKSMRLPYVVVDYNPDVISELEEQSIDYLYGDATDPELLAELGMEESKLIISTIGEHRENKLLINFVRGRNPEAVLICYSNTNKEAAELYELGATYVMLPHYIGSDQLNLFIHLNGLDKGSFDKYRKEHIAQIASSQR